MMMKLLLLLLSWHACRAHVWDSISVVEEELSESKVEVAFCTNDVAKSMGYCDRSKSFEERVDSLVDELTLKEKISLMSPDTKEGGTCDCHSSRVDRIGLSPYMWLTETNTNVATECLAPGKCSTSFIGPVGHGATFNRSSWAQKGLILSREVRAARNIGASRMKNQHEYIGVTGYGPNLNIIRDPRFGRISEVPSEDPYLAGELGAAFVRASQQPDENGYPRMVTLVKHFAAYSVEENRGNSDFNISKYDLFDTYLRQYEIVAKKAKPAGAMCSYNAINGHPSCSNGWLLNDVFRGRFGLKDAIVSSDCGAISNMAGAPLNVKTKAEMSAFAVNNGTDLEMGSTIFREEDGLLAAVAQNLTTEEVITTSVKRLYRWLMKAGIFDPFGTSSFDKLGYDDINSTYHQELAYEVSLQAPVLLRNDNNILPLDGTKLKGKVAILGPIGDETYSLTSSYSSQPFCFGGNQDRSCFWTIRQSFERYFGPVPFETGVSINGKWDDGDAKKAMDLAQKNTTEVIILTIGIGRDQEGEGHDRPNTDLPQVQERFVKQVLSLKKPTVILLFNGGALSVDFLRHHDESPIAIIDAFNPNQRGSRAIAELVLGKFNRWGKLPYTIYSTEYQHQVNKLDFDMAKAPGRTYRYFTGEPLWPFGFGLSYTTFKLHDCLCFGNSVKCKLTNTGKREGDEVVQVYHSHSDSIKREHNAHPHAIKSLVEFERFSVKAGETITVRFYMKPEEAFASINQHGERVVYNGTHHLTFTIGTEGGSAQINPEKCIFEL